MAKILAVVGTLQSIGEVKQVTEKLTVRDFVLKIDEDTEYPQTIKFQLSQARTSLLNSIVPGAKLMVNFNLRGREVELAEGKKEIFNNLEAWQIVPV